MYRTILRVAWRVLTIMLVLILASTTTFWLFPYLDRRLPVFPAVLLAYAVLAYILLPLASRFWRVVFRPDHIPRYVTTSDGWPADPVNIAFVVKDKQHLRRAMKRASWYEADPLTLKNMVREAYAIVANTMYLTAPFSKLYLFGRKFDIGFQQPIKGKAAPRHRHHMRLWQVTEQPDIDTHDHFAYWMKRLKHFFDKKQSVWIGAAIEDIDPIALQWRNLQVTHKNSHLHEKERDYIVSTLRDAGLVKSVHVIKDGESFTMRSQNIGTSFIVDGNILVVELKRSLIKRV